MEAAQQPPPVSDMETTPGSSQKRPHANSPDSPKKSKRRNSNASSTAIPTKSPEFPKEDTPSSEVQGLKPVPKKNTKISPIVIRSPENWITLSKEFSKLKLNISQARTISDGIKIFPMTENDHRGITKKLNNDKIPYHCFTLPSQRQLHVVVRGIPSDIPLEEVKADLVSQGLNITAISHMTNKATKKKYPMVLIQVPREQSHVYEVRYVCNLVVRVEAQRAKSGVSQCHRCQRFGHAQNLCAAPPECVRCGEGHLAKECQKSRDTPAVCANCGGSHPASYRGCPKFPKPTHIQAPKATPTSTGTQPSAPGRGGRKLDDVRDKYQKACRKLHLTHNEYVLLLCEAVEFEKDFRTVLLPGLLEHQQSLQEAFILSLLVEDSAGKLLPNQLTVDNLTVEWLRTKLNDLEASIKENQEKRNQLTNSHEGLANGKTTPTSEINNRLSTNVDTSKKEINELKCQERKMLKQTELIKSALNELGCEEVPSGCDLSLDNQTFISNSSEQGGSETHLSKRSPFNHQKLVKMLRKPFRRKSAPSSPVAPPRTRHSRSDSAPRSEGGDPVSITTNKSLVDEEWFHGVLPREEVVRLLTTDGDFLVRETTRNDECQTVLSVCWGGHKHFIVQTTAEGHYRFEGPAFPSIRELILYQFNSSLPVTGRSGAILYKPIPKERWELNNDDVNLLDKLGRVKKMQNFLGKLRRRIQGTAKKQQRNSGSENVQSNFTGRTQEKVLARRQDSQTV
ncbi:unnamed protein product [Brassicogethes aeneus]|uniref:SH2 domain-containing protein n=1 Tax=Brassicogethes aeneus TaxID=1431903 RepID=A0A9P0BAM8_BRAAE|nr:unnamed protein product [Brassicogethes aeneus]